LRSAEDMRFWRAAARMASVSGLRGLCCFSLRKLSSFSVKSAPLFLRSSGVFSQLREAGAALF